MTDRVDPVSAPTSVGPTPDTTALAETVRDALRDGAGPGDARYVYPEAWGALDALVAALDERTRERDTWKRAAEYQPSAWSDVYGAEQEARIAAEAALENARQALATFESAVRRALAVAPPHWHSYRDPFELSPEIRAARALARGVGLTETSEEAPPRGAEEGQA